MVSFRSETMQHGTLVLPADRARHFVEMLGRTAHIQFVDMNALSLKRQYRRYIQRIEEMERTLRFLIEEIKRLPDATILPADTDIFAAGDHGYQLDHVEEALQKLYQQFQRFQENNIDLALQKNRAIEERAVVQAALASMQEGVAPVAGPTPGLGMAPEFPGAAPPSEVTEAESLLGFASVAGVIASAEQDRLARTIFRATRGNAFTHFESIGESLIDIRTRKATPRSVFVIYFQAGAGALTLRAKISRICGAYGVAQYEWPRTLGEARQRAVHLDQLIQDKSRALTAYEEYFSSEATALLEVHSASGGSLIDDYRLFCIKEKSIYATLDLFEGKEATLRADCWLPKEEEEAIRRQLTMGATPSQASAFLLTDKTALKQAAPTYIRTTEFTAPFQSFVDTYGVPRYKEANPALLTIISFPFLFGIMYGDMGHAACLLAFGVFLVVAWDRLRASRDEMVLMIAGGRYMIVLMALFAVYAGLLYNEFFSLGLDLFGTRYIFDRSEDGLVFLKFDPNRTPYPFGFDPAWKNALNELQFTNSFKMKFAIIVGFTQMTTGIVLKGLNTLYFQDRLTFAFEFIPQLLFMFALVGFMNFLIFFKWATPEGLIDGQSNRPLIITNVIEMAMLHAPRLVAFRGQHILQKVCFVVLVVSVPLMLFPKPLILRMIHGQRQEQQQQHIRGVRQGGRKGDIEMDAEDGQAFVFVDEEFDFGEEMIHQVIETIEFVLGTISNTASYLRLWALSLAHQQLALVFFNMTIRPVLGMDLNVIAIGIILFFVFVMFAAITFGVLLCMDTLECFLHALRLQWVEFQNKFYKADGYPFEPFSFKRTLATAHE